MGCSTFDRSPDVMQDGLRSRPGETPHTSLQGHSVHGVLSPHRWLGGRGWGDVGAAVGWTGFVPDSINGYEPCLRNCVNGRMNPDYYRLKAIRVPLELIDSGLSED